MHSLWTKRVLVAALVCVLPERALAADADVEARLEALADRVGQLEDRLTKATDELEEARRTVERQQQVIEEAGIETDADSQSALSSFFEKTDVGGWVATSYAWNTETGSNDGISGQNDGLPFHDDSNSFKVNQVWFEIDKDVDEDSRAGFHVDLLFGSDAEVLGGNGGDLFRSIGASGNDGFELFTAYVSYLAPIGPGVRIDMGELPTLLGAEVVQSPYNNHITRGRLWGLQPVTHTGIIFSTAMDNGLGFAAGFVNDGFTDFNVDNDNNKAFTGQVSYGDETFSGAISILYGSPNLDATDSSVGGPVITNNEQDKVGMLDLLLTAQPADNLSIWFNFDWAFDRDATARSVASDPTTTEDIKDADVFGWALGARLAVLDTTGVSLRGEILMDDDNYLGLGGSGENLLYTLTATVDHTLADGLVARLEGRFDFADIDGASSKIFLDASGDPSESTQQVLLAELIYNF